MNRLLIHSAVLAIALIVLIGLFIGATDNSSRAYSEFERRIRSLEHANLNLDSSVLALRLGIQHNYDQLTFHETELQNSLNDLEANLGIWHENPGVNQLATILQKLGESKLTQSSDFKASHSIVKNSLAACSTIARRLQNSNDDEQKGLITDLESCGLRFYTSGYNVDERAFRNAIDAIMADEALFADHQKNSTSLLLRHSYKLIELRNDMQQSLQSLVQTPVRQTTEQLKERVSILYHHNRERQAGYRIGLIAVSLMLFAYCVVQAFWVYKYARALQNSNQELEKRVEERTADLRDSKEFFQTVLDSIHAQVCVLDETGNIIEANAAFKRIESPSHTGDASSNYLEYCNAPEQNQSIANGKVLGKEIRAVLNADKPYGTCEFNEFHIEESRTYQVNVTRLPESSLGSIVVAKSNITDRIVAEKEREQLHKELQDAARQAGMAEVAAGVLHNVGNVLNSVNVSSNVLRDRIESSPVKQLVRAADVIQGQSDQLSEFFASDPRGEHFPSLLTQLSSNLDEENKYLAEEVTTIAKNIDHIKEIVSMHQSFVKKRGVMETINPIDLVEDALRINEASLNRHQVAIARNYGNSVPAIPMARHGVLQILVNLIKNAKQAAAETSDACIQLIVSREDDFVTIEVRDNGIGIPEHHLQKVFCYGFTTKDDGNGFGLHSSANTAREFGGSLSAHSEGEGTGATFKLRLPTKPETKEVDATPV